MVIYKPCGFQFNILYHATVLFPLLNLYRLQLFLKLPEANQNTHTHTHTQRNTHFFQTSAMWAPCLCVSIWMSSRLWPADPELDSLASPEVSLFPYFLLFILPSQAKPQVLEDFTLIHAHWFIIHSEHAGIQGWELHMLTIAVVLIFLEVKVNV